MMLWTTVVEATDTIVQSGPIPLSQIFLNANTSIRGQTPQITKMKDFLALYHDLSDQQKRRQMPHKILSPMVSCPCKEEYLILKLRRLQI